MYAVVATGGKQHLVSVGEEIVVEKLNTPVGESVSFDVIFLADGEEIVVDADKLAASTVTAEVLEHFKGDKVIIFKFKKRKGYKRLKGHRQQLTRVRITDMTTGDAKPKRSTAKKKVEVAGEAAVAVVENEDVVVAEAPKASKAVKAAAPKAAAPKAAAPKAAAPKAAAPKAAAPKAAAPKAAAPKAAAPKAAAPKAAAPKKAPVRKKKADAEAPAKATEAPEAAESE